MFECIYGYTPFACDDRHKTKLKILKHKSTFGFPQVDSKNQPSTEAMDVMMRLLVEKEKRLCSRKYRLNDYTTQLIAGRPVKFAADKHHKNYEGYFVYPDDADDLKRHPFFNGIPWTSMLKRRAPFKPKVENWEDTKYFEEDHPISDIDNASSDDEPPAATDAKENQVLLSPPGSKASQHQHEDQHIVPSVAIKPSGAALAMPQQVTEEQTQASSPILMEQTQIPVPPAETIVKKHKKKERKRPRDKILRDPISGREALKLRKDGAFQGYAYSKPKCVEDLIDEVMDAHAAEWNKYSGSVVSAPLAPRL